MRKPNAVLLSELNAALDMVCARLDTASSYAEWEAIRLALSQATTKALFMRDRCREGPTK